MKTIVIGAMVLLVAGSAHAQTAPVQTRRARLADLPMQFEANLGQAAGTARFLARGHGYSLMLAPEEAVLVLAGDRTSATVRMSLAGANRAPQMAGVDELPGKVNYLRGSDPTKWRTGVRTYAKVKYASVYPGIDLLYYGSQGNLEYDFVVAPRASPRSIRLRFDSADAVVIDTDGTLRLKTPTGDLRMRAPVTYQQTNVGRQEIVSRYVRRQNGQIGFEVGAYDRSRPLIIDPVLAYSTYFGGAKDDEAHAIAVDAAGSVYFAGETNSNDLATSAGAFQTTRAPFAPDSTDFQHDVFVTKLNPAATAIIYSTYLGGGHDDRAFGIAIDAAGSAYVTGTTRSANFPTVNAPQPMYGGTSYLATSGDAFVAKLASNGSSLVYSTYAGGVGADGGRAITVDAAGRAHVVGGTGSADFPVVNQPPQSACPGAFLLELNPIGTAFTYSICVPGLAGSAIATNTQGLVYVAGTIVGTPPPVIPPPTGFLAIFTPTGALLSLTDFPTIDHISGLAIDVAGFIYVTGDTSHPDFPVVNAAQPLYGGREICCGVGDAFVAKLDPSGSAFVYATFLGGSRGDKAHAIAVDSAGAATVVGFTESLDFPTVNPLQPAGPGFVTQLTPSGAAFSFSTYLGGNDWVTPLALAVDAAGDAYVAGMTLADDFMTATPLQPSLYGFRDAFVSKFTHAPVPGILALDPALATQGVTVPVTISGLNFVSGATSVGGGPSVSASGTDVSSATSLTTNLTIAADAPLGRVDVTATTPQGTSNRRQFTIYSSQPGCRVSLPVAVDGTPLDPFAHFGIGALEPTDGTWLLLLVIYQSGSVTMSGQGLYQGPIPTDQPPMMLSRNLFVDPPVLAVVNAFFNPALCAFNVALTPTVDPSKEQELRDVLTGLLGQLALP